MGTSPPLEPPAGGFRERGAPGLQAHLKQPEAAVVYLPALYPCLHFKVPLKSLILLNFKKRTISSANSVVLGYLEHMALTSWRPDKGQLQEAKTLLQGITGQWVQNRLAILDALGSMPASTDQQIARKVGTRTKVVTGLADRWRAEGIQSVARFGRPNDLDSTTLSEIRAKIESGELRCLAEVKKEAFAKVRQQFAISTLRGYCRNLGYNLPSQLRSPSKNIPRKSLRQQWSSEQKSELEKCEPSMRALAAAILEVGTLPNKSVTSIARAQGLPAATLRLNVKRFAKGGLKEVMAHLRRGDVLERNGLQSAFFDWCNRKYEPFHQCPSMADAKKFLKSLKIKMQRRTVWTHLAKWRKSRNIPARKYRIKWICR